MKSKNRSCFSQVSSNKFIITIAKVKKSGIDSTSTVAMVTRMVRKNMLKIGKWPFWSKYKTCNRGINIEHKQIPNRYFIRW